MKVDLDRVRLISPDHIDEHKPLTLLGPVLFWMARDMRFHDNWALLYAQELAMANKVPIVAMFAMPDKFLDAGLRQYLFTLDGMEESASYFQSHNIPFAVISGDPSSTVTDIAKQIDASAIVTDFNPLRINRQTKQKITKTLPSTPFYEVDTHNIVPVWKASPKLEFCGIYSKT
jgi:deoxyribodipyrimidine photo-lyase